MKLWDVVKAAGAAVVRNAVPGGGLLIDAVNEMLPDEHKLPGDATGADVERAAQFLTPDQRAALLNKELDIDLAELVQPHLTNRAMLEAEQTSQQSTRPRIAWYGFVLLAVVTLVIACGWGYAVLVKDAGLVTSITSGWPFVAALIAPFVTWLNAYFGVLKTEQRQRLNAGLGSPTQSILAGLLKR